MPIIYTQSNILNFPKNNNQYVKTSEDIQRENDKAACKQFRDEEREKRNQERNERQKDQFEYYIGLYEKYGSKDWDFIQMKLKEEKIKNQIKNEARQKEIQHAYARLNHFGPQNKKDMDHTFAYNDKNKWQ